MTATLKPEELAAKIRSMYHYELTKQIEPWAALWDNNARVTFPHDVNPKARDVIGKDAIVAWTAKKFVERASSEIDAKVEAMAGGNRVFASLHVVLNFANGTTMSGPLIMIFNFNDAGLIVHAEEYVNEAMWPSNYKELAKPAGAAR